MLAGEGFDKAPGLALPLAKPAALVCFLGLIALPVGGGAAAVGGDAAVSLSGLSAEAAACRKGGGSLLLPEDGADKLGKCRLLGEDGPAVRGFLLLASLGNCALLYAGLTSLGEGRDAVPGSLPSAAALLQSVSGRCNWGRAGGEGQGGRGGG